MDNKKLIKNYIFNTSYQLLALIVPLITTPYISRTLKPHGIGEYSYTYSIVCYFTLFAILGTSTFGQKEIGILQDDAIKRTKKFWDIFSFRFITSIIAFLIYNLYVLLIAKNKIIALIQSLYIINVSFDVVWFFQGMEDFKKIAIRNYILKILNIIIIFIYINNENDLWKYTLSLALLTCIGNLSILPFLKKYLIPLKKYTPKPFNKIKIIFQLFIPSAALQFYSIVDKTMIGQITSNAAQNGFYEQSEKIVKMCLMLVTTLPTVILPKISKAFAEKNTEQIQKYIYIALNFVWFLGTPLMFGTISISSILVPVFFGNGYESICDILPIMSILFLIMGFNQTCGTQFFIASGKQNIYTKNIIIGGIVNIIGNFLLITKFGALGAAISSVLGEIIITLLEFIYLYNNTSILPLKIIKMGKKYLISSFIMFISITLLKKHISINIFGLIILIFTGIAIYFIALLLEKEIFVTYFVKKAKKKFKN